MAGQHKASLLPEKQGKLEVSSRITPTPEGKHALVKLTAAAINPFDWKVQNNGIYVTNFPAVLGSDGAGIIESVGPEVTDFKPGDKVFFQGQYIPDEATFQQYTLVDTEIISKIPENINDDQASTIPVATMAAVFGLFQKTGIAFPESGPTASGKSILILGGSSSVGQFTIQLARIAGFSPIVTTASPQHEDLLKSLGATHIIDRNADVKTIQSAFSTPVTLVFDSIAHPATQAFAFDVLTTPSPAPGAHLSSALPLDQSVKEKYAGKQVSVHEFFGISHHDKALSVPFWRAIGRWIKEGKFEPNRVQVVGGGLASIPEALELSRKGVSAVKLVIHPQE